MQKGLVVEDLPASADWLAGTLAEAFPGMRVQKAGTLTEARRAARQMQPDIALIDLGLPDGSGLDLIREMVARNPECHCIVSTVYADDRHLFPALRAGAGGYLLKDQPKDRVIASLKGIAAGEPPLSPVIAARLLRVFGADQLRNEPPPEPLSGRERETLILIAKGFRLPEVALQLGVTRNTAAGFIKAIYRKLRVSTRAEAALEAARMGLVDTKL